MEEAHTLYHVVGCGCGGMSCGVCCCCATGRWWKGGSGRWSRGGSGKCWKGGSCSRSLVARRALVETFPEIFNVLFCKIYLLTNLFTFMYHYIQHEKIRRNSYGIIYESLEKTHIISNCECLR